ncbi:MAG: exodeoxyribonuclease V subunit gamma, partial [Thermoleophilia bacterium]|nr:exodeoxyribonuclease V subunit gamma [Thermoleophilia bacterium]
MLHVHRGERADALAGALADLLAAPPDDPLAPEVVAVPTRGVERWLAQTLATRLGAGGAGTGDGVAANLRFPFPGRLVGQALAAATGLDPADDPWRPERLAWPLLGVVDALAADPRLAPVRGQLTGPGRLTAVRHVADLFDRYGVHRPALLLEWARADPGEGWQPLLWRGLRDRLGVASPAERVGPACARLREDPALADLPARFAVFGLTRLPATYLEVLRALAAARDAHLFLLHPSPALWSAVEARRGAAPASGRRADDGTAHLARNPLLASWGRDAREMQLIMGGGDGAGAHHAGPAPADTLLGRLQADVRADRPPGQGAGPLPCLDPGDRSVQVHACHGRVRQVEVLRDAVLHLMQEDPTLEPRDVIVMCPDVEAFAPLVTAVLGGDGSGPSAARPPDLRVRLADRSLRQTNPLLGVVAEVLAMAGGRAGASEVLSLAGRPPVRRRFALDEDDLATLAGWVAATGVRWGLDAAHRAAWDLDGVAEGTWRAGLDRILLGAAMADEEARLVGGVLPLDEVGAQGADLAGRLAELVTRLGDAMRDLDAGPRALHEWAAAITAAADALAEAAPHEAWQREELGRLLAGAVEEAGGAEDPVDLDEVRHLLADRLRGRPTRANFRTGHLTVCTLVPMRSVPHRVVCLMGLDDGAFPRAGAPDGDDLLAGDPHVGDRDVRGEDRQLLLDALMAAGSHLVVTYAGRDERTNAPLPPAVPVGELL